MDAQMLPTMGQLKHIGEPGGYQQVTIGIKRTDCSTPAPITALVYFTQYPSAKST